MNKVIFSEGGQPIYLDDLDDLQKYAAQHIDLILEALGVDTEASIYFVKKPTLQRDGTAATFSDGIIWHSEHGLIRLAGAEDLELGDAGNAWIRITQTSGTPRLFEDGQQHDTRSTVTAQIVNTYTGDEYPYFAIEDMFSQLAELIDTRQSMFTEIQTVWANGYDGIVEYKNIFGGKRYHIRATSVNDVWEENIDRLIGTAPFGERIVTPRFMTNELTTQITQPPYIAINSQGQMKLYGQYSGGPDDNPIDITFDVLHTE